MSIIELTNGSTRELYISIIIIVVETENEVGIKQ